MDRIQKLITDHINTWSSVKARNKSGRGRSNTNDTKIYGILKLRELILDLAIRGKIVSQNLNDENASELLKKIIMEKDNLIAEGKLKKIKSSAVIVKKNKSLQIPTNWVWTTIANVLIDISNGYTGAQNKIATPFPVTRIETISNSLINFEKVGYCHNITESEVEKYKLYAGDILMSNINSDYHLGKTAVYDEKRLLIHGTNLLLLRPSKFVCSHFIDKFFNNKRLSGYFISIAQHAIGQSSINQSKILQIPIALPPLREQERIVSKVDELMALCDQLEQKHINSEVAHEKLIKVLLDSLTQYNDPDKIKDIYQNINTHFNTLFTTEESVRKLKKTLVDLAIMGKLVPQDHKEESACELIKKIQVKKNKLINERKIKKEKLSTHITENEKLFKLPKGWEWIRLNNFSEIKGGKRLPAGETFSTNKTPYIYIQVTNMKNGVIVDENLKYINKETHNKICQYTISSKDLYITIAGTIGDVGSVPDRFDGMNLTENAAKIVFHDVNKEWLIYSLASTWSKKQFLNKSVKVAQPKLGLHKISTSIIALPPLKEQQRIVNKLKELIFICNKLESRILQASLKQKQVADALVSQSLH